MIHPIPEARLRARAKPNWWKRCGYALLAGSMVGLLFWCLTDCFSSAFTITTGLVLSCMWIERFDSTCSYCLRPGNWLAHSCTHWRCTRQGICIYGHHEPMPCLFLPWESLQAATQSENGIMLEDERNDTFYELPIAENQQAEYLAHMQEAIRLHHTEAEPEEETTSKPVCYLMSPHQLPAWKHLKYSLPWVALGLLSPVLWPGEIIPCLVCFELAGSIGSSVLTDFENDYDIETYMGEETRRSKRGLSIRMDSGIRCFIPWEYVTEGTQLEDRHVFLQLRGGVFGLALANTDGSLPVPLTRLFLKRHRLARKLAKLALIILLLAVAVLWACWNFSPPDTHPACNL